MRTRLQFCLIFVFLLLNVPGVRAQDNTALAAALYEKALYEGLPLAEQISVLLAKSECLMAMEDWQAALESLRRVPMFAAGDVEKRKLALYKLRCLAMTEAYDEFDSELQESILTGLVNLDASEGPVPPRQKNEDVAMLLSVVPGLGHVYAGRPKAGLGEFVLNATVIGAGVAAFCSSLYSAAFLGAGMILARTHTENTASAINAVRERNALARSRYCMAVLECIESNCIYLHN